MAYSFLKWTVIVIWIVWLEQSCLSQSTVGPTECPENCICDNSSFPDSVCTKCKYGFYNTTTSDTGDMEAAMSPLPGENIITGTTTETTTETTIEITTGTTETLNTEDTSAFTTTTQGTTSTLVIKYQCQSCMDGCAVCINEKSCTECKDDHIKINERCISLYIIIGPAAGGLLIIIIIIVVTVCCCCRCKKRKKVKKNSESSIKLANLKPPPSLKELDGGPQADPRYTPEPDRKRSKRNVNGYDEVQLPEMDGASVGASNPTYVPDERGTSAQVHGNRRNGPKLDEQNLEVIRRRQTSPPQSPSHQDDGHTYMNFDFQSAQNLHGVDPSVAGNDVDEDEQQIYYNQAIIDKTNKSKTLPAIASGNSRKYENENVITSLHNLGPTGLAMAPQQGSDGKADDGSDNEGDLYENEEAAQSLHDLGQKGLKVDAQQQGSNYISHHPPTEEEEQQDYANFPAPRPCEPQEDYINISQVPMSSPTYANQ